MAITVTHSKTLVAPDTGSEDKVYGQDYVSASSHTFNGFGTGVETALAINVGTAGAVVINGGALGTPSGGTATNITGLPEGGLSLTDITMNNSSTSKHGFLLKLNNSATSYMDGTGAWSTPVGTLAIGKAVTGGNANSLLIEDASSNLAAPSGLTWGPTAGQGLTIAAGSAATAVSPLSITGTWAGNVVHPGILYAITNSSAAQGSTIFNTTIGGNSIFRMKLDSGSNQTTVFDMHGTGAGQATGIFMYDGPDSANSAYMAVGASSAGTWFGTSSGSIISSSKNGTGTQLPLKIGGYNGSAWVDWVQISTAGATGFGALPFGGAATVTGALDVAFSRVAAGKFGVGTGAAGSIAGSMQMTKLYLDYTNTGTVGDVTINKASGRVNLGAGGTTLTLTNSTITAASKVIAIADGAPGNLVAVQIYTVPAAGSCTINAVPAVTNQTAIDFVVINAD